MAAALATIAALLAALTPASAFVGVNVGSSLKAGMWRTSAASSSHLSMSATSRVENVAAILLAGGVGKRMEAERPKQFLELQGETVLEHSLKLFLSLKGVSQLVLVLDERYRPMLADLQGREPRLVFADPGTERQDSVYNALQKVDRDASLVCIHDAARPLVTKDSVYKVISDADEHGAAVLGVLMKATVKESEDGQFVQRTIARSRLWDIQTPQVVKPDILIKGFEEVKKNGWEVTDDVSIVEQLGLPVKITEGEYTNLKLTTPEDLVIAAQILEARRISDWESDADDDSDEEEEYLSVTRANEVWTDTPHAVGEEEEEDIESISELRADEKWVDSPVGNAPPGEGDVEILMDLSTLRANE
eukprot:jgi/Undpi1/14231/HiC_scaffold_9.g03880.m1